MASDATARRFIEEVEEMTQRITRRRLLLTTAGTVAGLAIVACSQPPAPSAKPADAQKPAEAAKPAAAPTSAPAAAAKPAEAAKPAAAAPTTAPAVATKPAGTSPAGKLTVATSPEPGPLRPSGLLGGGTYFSMHNLYETLIDVDLEEKKIPGLATSWKAINNGTAYEFELRKGVTFHNGYPFTAHDVKFTLEKFKEPAAPNRVTYEMIDRAEVVDDHKVVLHLNKPYPSLPGNLVPGFFMGSAKYNQEVGDDGELNHPVGIGPFKFVKRQINEFIELEAFEEHPYRVPSVKNLTLRMVPDDQTKIALLQTGEVDIAHNLSPLAAKQLQGIPGVTTIGAGYAQIMSFTLDMKRAPEGHPIRDVRVRQALNYAVDKQAILDKLLFGQGTLVGSAWTPGCLGYDPVAVPPYPYDPAKAKQLLEAAGFGQGFDMKLYGVIARYPASAEVTEAVATYLQAVGVRVEVNNIEYGDWAARRRNQDNLSLWPAHMYGASARGGEMTGDLEDSFMTKADRSTFANPEFDKAIQEASAVLDEAERGKAMLKAFKILHDEAAALFLFEPISPAAYGSRVKVWQMVKTRAWGEYYNVELNG